MVDDNKIDAATDFARMASTIGDYQEVGVIRNGKSISAFRGGESVRTLLPEFKDLILKTLSCPNCKQSPDGAGFQQVELCAAHFEEKKGILGE